MYLCPTQPLRFQAQSRLWLMGFFQEKSHLSHYLVKMQFGTLGMTLQEVRNIKLYFCYYFCSKILLLYFALYKLLQEQKTERIVQQNRIIPGKSHLQDLSCLWKVSYLLILLQFTKLTFVIAPNMDVRLSLYSSLKFKKQAHEHS